MRLKFSASNLAAAISQEIGSAIAAANSTAKGIVSNLADQAYYKAREMAGVRLNSTSQQYIDALKMEKVGDDMYSVSLDESSEYLENGYPSYDMKAGLLKTSKGYSDLPPGKGGSRGGVKMSKKGYRYRSIPFEQNQAASKSGHPQNQQPVQAHQTSLGNVAPMAYGDLMSAAKDLTKRANKITSANGVGGTGKVWTIQQNPLNTMQAIVKDKAGNQTTLDLKAPMDSRLKGMMRVDYEVEKRGGGKMNKSQYVTFRTVSENPKQKGKWIHPGFAGAKVFPDLEIWAENQLTKLMEEAFGR